MGILMGLRSWNPPPPHAIERPMRREHVSVPRRRHRYKVGDQHQRSAQHWEASFDTGPLLKQTCC